MSQPAPGLDVPRLDISDAGAVLALPEEMQAVLEAYAPGFQTWTLDQYVQDVAAHARPPERLPLFGVVGDFNGDGVLDAALQGFVAQHELLFVLLSNGRIFRVVEIERAPQGTPGRPISRYLRPVPPGEVQVPEGIREIEGPPPTLTTDAFELIFEGQAGVLYYWQQDRFVRYITGD